MPQCISQHNDTPTTHYFWSRTIYGISELEPYGVHPNGGVAHHHCVTEQVTSRDIHGSVIHLYPLPQKNKRKVQSLWKFSMFHWVGSWGVQVCYRWWLSWVFLFVSRNEALIGIERKRPFDAKILLQGRIDQSSSRVNTRQEWILRQKYADVWRSWVLETTSFRSGSLLGSFPDVIERPVPILEPVATFHESSDGISINGNSHL